MNENECALQLHREHRGKFTVASKVNVDCMADLSLAYTPGVAEPCRKIHKKPDDVYTYTAKGNLVAVVSDGTAVLGLGNIGPEAAMPVMEGKAILFKQFGDVDAVPLCIRAKDAQEIVQIVKSIAPTFGGINLEDISSPNCFEVEEELERSLDIPVFHDDQHGTAIVVAAAVLNALKLVGKSLKEAHIVLNGPGAAGTAILRMLSLLGAGKMLACDEFGILQRNRSNGMLPHKLQLCDITNPHGRTGDLTTAIQGADLFIGVSVGAALTKEMVATMNPNAIVFAMANPVPEIMYDDAIAAGAAIVGTGRSDFPNQINNVLAFPGVFRGALDARARDINSEMKLAAVHAIADLVSDAERTPTYIIPAIFDKRVTTAVAKQVYHAAIASGVSKLS